MDNKHKRYLFPTNHLLYIFLKALCHISTDKTCHYMVYWDPVKGDILCKLTFSILLYFLWVSTEIANNKETVCFAKNWRQILHSCEKRRSEDSPGERWAFVDQGLCFLNFGWHPQNRSWDAMTFLFSSYCAAYDTQGNCRCNLSQIH